MWLPLSVYVWIFFLNGHIHKNLTRDVAGNTEEEEGSNLVWCWIQLGITSPSDLDFDSQLQELDEAKISLPIISQSF